MRARFPDMICIGAQKAATTWLYRMLRERREFYVPAFKELHYFTQIHQPEIGYTRNHRAVRAGQLKTFFVANPNHPRARERLADAELLGRPEVDDHWYASIFGQALPEQVCVDVCPSYLHLPEPGVQHALRLNPSVRVLLFVRDPVDRAWSHIRMHLARGAAPLDADALLSGKHPMAPYLANSEYRDSITLWRKLSAPGQLNIMLYDDVASDPASIISGVCEISGILPLLDLGDVHREIHKGKEFDFPKPLRASLLEKLAAQYDYLGEDFPDAVSRWLTKHRAALA